MNEYQKRKAHAIATAQEWQQEASNTAQSYGELLTAQAYFSKMAKRYGLLKNLEKTVYYNGERRAGLTACQK